MDNSFDQLNSTVDDATFDTRSENVTRQEKDKSQLKVPIAIGTITLSIIMLLVVVGIIVIAYIIYRSRKEVDPLQCTSPFVAIQRQDFAFEKDKVTTIRFSGVSSYFLELTDGESIVVNSSARTNVEDLFLVHTEVTGDVLTVRSEVNPDAEQDPCLVDGVLFVSVVIALPRSKRFNVQSSRGLLLNDEDDDEIYTFQELDVDCADVGCIVHFNNLNVTENLHLNATFVYLVQSVHAKQVSIQNFEECAIGDKLTSMNSINVDGAYFVGVLESVSLDNIRLNSAGFILGASQFEGSFIVSATNNVAVTDMRNTTTAMPLTLTVNETAVKEGYIGEETVSERLNAAALFIGYLTFYD